MNNCRIVTDQLERQVQLPIRIEKIISLVPSQTEFLFDLGLDQEIIGVTRYCIHPQGKVSGKATIGGTKNFDVRKITSLNPDLVLANKEENIREGINALAENLPVWVSDINNLQQALEMMSAVGEITGRQGQAKEIISTIQGEFSALPFFPSLKVVYMIWRKPYMVAAGGTFIDFVLTSCGLVNLMGTLSRYPVVSAEELQKLNPDLVFLSSEPYPFVDKHIAEFRQLCPSANVLLVDGEMFSWYGSRLRYSVEYFRNLERKL